MIIGLRGHTEGQENDPFWLVPPSPLDAPVLMGGLTKDRREDLQMYGFVYAVSFSIDSRHPIGITLGDDPPDRFVHVGGKTQSFELTELTMFDVRQDLAQARKLGRLLQGRIIKEHLRHGHLLGRRVAVAVESGMILPRDLSNLTDELIEVLQEDQGCVGDNVDLSEGFPQQWPNSRGFYGQHGPVNMHVYSDGWPGEVIVNSATQAEVRLSEAIDVFQRRVEAKDSPTNEVLLVSCGMPDERGYVCNIDSYMFRLIIENASRLEFSPRHLKAIFIHLWGSLEWFELYRLPGALEIWPMTQA